MNNDFEIQGLEEDDDTIVMTFTDPTGRVRKNMTQKQLEDINLPFFRAFENFGENDMNEIKLQCDEVAKDQLGAWKTLFGSLTDPVHLFAINQTLSTFMLFDYIYCGKEHAKFIEMMEVILSLFKTHFAHQFTVDGLRQLQSMLRRSSYRLYMECEYEMCGGYCVCGEEKPLMPKLFRPPGDEKELDSYCVFKECLAEDPEFAFLHSKSLRRVQTCYGKYSTDKIDIPGHFIDYITKFGQGLFYPETLSEDCVISGGSIVSAYFNLPNTSPDADLDLWVSSKEKLFDVVNFYKCKHPHAFFIVNYTVVTVVVPDKTLYIQIIFKNTCPWGIIDSFDMDYVQAYYDGSEIRAFPECIHAWKTKTTTCVRRERIHPERILKAREKGFEIDHETDLPPKKSRWNFYYPKSDENRAHVRHLLSCLYPRSQGVFDSVEDVKENFFTISQDPYQTVEIGLPQVLEDFQNIESMVTDVGIPHGGGTIKRLLLTTPVVFKAEGLHAPWGADVHDHGNGGMWTDKGQLNCISGESTFVEMLKRLDTELQALLHRNKRGMNIGNDSHYYPLVKENEYHETEIDKYRIALKIRECGPYTVKGVDGPSGDELSYSELGNLRAPFTVDIEGVVTHCWANNLGCGSMAQLTNVTVWPCKVLTGSGVLCGVLRGFRE